MESHAQGTSIAMTYQMTIIILDTKNYSWKISFVAPDSASSEYIIQPVNQIVS